MHRPPSLAKIFLHRWKLHTAAFFYALLASVAIVSVITFFHRPLLSLGFGAFAAALVIFNLLLTQQFLYRKTSYSRSKKASAKLRIINSYGFVFSYLFKGTETYAIIIGRLFVAITVFYFYSRRLLEVDHQQPNPIKDHHHSHIYQAMVSHHPLVTMAFGVSLLAYAIYVSGKRAQDLDRLLDQEVCDNRRELRAQKIVALSRRQKNVRRARYLPEKISFLDMDDEDVAHAMEQYHPQRFQRLSQESADFLRRLRQPLP